MASINSTIAFTYISTNKRLTFVAALGVLLGMAVYIFMNSMMAGFDRTSAEAIFKSTPHIRIYKDDEISQSLIKDAKKPVLISNPKIVPNNNTIVNPKELIQLIQNQEGVITVMPQVNVNLFYNLGRSLMSGHAVGLLPDEGNKMFNIKSFMVEGSIEALKNNQNGIVIGSGIAQKMNLKTGDNISITSSKGVSKTMNVVGIFQTNNSKEDKSRSYINIQPAQQLLKESASYITDINVNIKDSEQAPQYASRLTELTGYTAEDWKAANETLMAASRMRKIVITFVSFTILLVAGFGIYNILNMTVSQKINDIAILKAMGFKGGDVIRIFVTQAITIGLIGIVLGVIVATIMINLLQHVYIGGDIGYFPIRFEPLKFAQGILFGFIITFLAGYMPARKAAKVDPVSIFRK